MKINTKIRYSLRILYTLAKEKRIMNTAELAKQTNLSPFYLRQIVIPLEKEGMISSKRGVKGGYKLAHAPEDINVFQVANSFGETFDFLNCVSDHDSCVHNSNCDITNFWSELSSIVVRFTKKTTVKDLYSKYKKAKSTH